MSSNVVLIVVCALTLGVTGYVAANLPDRGLAGAGGPDGGAEERLAALERRTAAMTATLGELRDTVVRIDRRISRDATRAGAVGGEATNASAGGAGLAESSAGGSRARNDGVAGDSRDSGGGDVATPGGHFSGAAGDAVAARLEKRIEAVAARERARGDDGKWKAPIDELADELGADAAEKADIARVFDGGRDQMCRLLLTQQGDGKSLLDDYAKDIRETGDGPAATQRFFKRVIAEKVPGTDETYFAAITKVNDNIEQELARRLGEERTAKLKALRVDLLDVRTGHDPVGDALRERLQK